MGPLTDLVEDLKRRLLVSDVVRRRCTDLKKSGSEWKCLSPFQKENSPSFTVNDAKQLWHDFSSGKGGDIVAFEMAVTGCTFVAAVETLAQLAGVPMPAKPGSNRNATPAQDRDPRDTDEIPPPDMESYGAAPAASSKREITKTYDYTDADGGLIYQVCRLEWREGVKRKKTFMQRRKVSGVDGWVWGLTEGDYLRGRNGEWYTWTQEREAKMAGAKRETFQGVAHGLYRFEALRQEMAYDADDRRTVLLCEGEKDADTLTDWGLLAITNSGGARHWLPHHAEELRGADVVILLDNDKAGREGGHKKAASLRGIAKSVRVLDWREHWTACPEKGDVTDWRDHGGGTANKLFQIIDTLGPWVPTAPESEFEALRFVDLDKPARELEWLIKNVITRGEVSIWFGPPSCGKTFLITDAAMGIARGIPWFGQRTRPGLVVYQASEGALGLRSRLKAYRVANRVPKDEDVPFVLLPKAVDLYANDADVTKLIAEIKAWASFYDVPLELVVIDTLSAATPGANENASEDVTKVLARCKRISKETNAHVALVHHTNAKGDKPRGHTSLLGNVDNAIEVIRTDQVDSEEIDGKRIQRDIREFISVKQKDAPDRIRKFFILKQVILGQDQDGDDITSCIIAPLTAEVHADRNTVPVGWCQLNTANVDIFRSLVRALKNHGQYGAPGVPDGEFAVRIRDWQDALVETHVGHETITDTLRERIKKRVQRATKAWGSDGKINILRKEGEWVWRTERRVHLVDDPPRPKKIEGPRVIPGSGVVPPSAQGDMLAAPNEDPDRWTLDP